MGILFSWFQSIQKALAPDPAIHLSPRNAFQKIKSIPPPQLLDVRSREEYQQGRIAGSRLIPLQDLGNRLRELDKNKPLIVYCRGGYRSGAALRLLRAQGFHHAAHIAGGITAWNHSGFPVETQ